jgi:ABC-type multidrug transport system fused ATPase/permease subunit
MKQPVTEQAASEARSAASADSSSAVGKVGVFSQWLKARRALGISRRSLAILAALSLIAGLAEALALVLVVQVVIGLTSDARLIKVKLGPVGSYEFASAPLLILAVGLIVMVFCLQVATSFSSARLTALTLSNVRKTMFARFLRASWELQSRELEGHLQELLNTFALRIMNGVFGITVGFVAVFNIMALLGAALLISPVGALTILVTMVVLFLSLQPLSRITRKHSAQWIRDHMTYAQTVSGLVSLTREIKTFNVAEGLNERAGHTVDEVSRHLFWTRFLTLVSPDAYQNAAFVLVLVGLAIVSMIGAVTLTALGGVILLLIRAVTYGRSLQSLIAGLHEGTPYLEKFLLRSDEYAQAASQYGTAELEKVEKIAFEHVDFSYDGVRPVLADVSIDLPLGEIIGIVGPSGAGKSTFLQLLLRLRDPKGGRYAVNGQAACDYSVDDWYKRFTYVPQECHLFSGTVAENIRFFRDGIDDAAMEWAARKAHIHDDILTWSEGYDTQVGPGGGAVSGGQRQRICLARALVGRPDIIVLDEPTSALDMRSEALVQQTLGDLKGRVTTFIVAHRMSTLNSCDRIMVFGEGRLQAFDRPSVLLESNGFYRDAINLSRTVAR